MKYWQYWNIVIPRKQWIYSFSNSTDFVLLPHLLPSMLGAVHVCERAGHLPLLQWNHPRYQVTRQFICVKDCSDYIFTQLHVYVCMLTVECSLYICPIFVYIRSYINDFVNWSKKKDDVNVNGFLREYTKLLKPKIGIILLALLKLQIKC